MHNTKRRRKKPSRTILKSSENKYQTLFETSRDFVFMVEKNGRWTDVNEAGVKLFGYRDKQELMQTNMMDIYLNPEDRWNHLTHIENVGFSENYEVALRDKQGKPVHVLINSVPILDPQEKITIGYQGIMTDITKRKQREEQLHTLLQKLKKSNKELKSAHLQLIQAEKMKSVGQLAAGVVHEVKNPLSVMLQGLEFIAQKVAKDDKEAISVFRLMEESIKRADHVIRGLLNFSSSRALSMEKKDLNNVISQALVLVQHELHKNRIDLNKKLKEGVVWVNLDKGKIEQVFINLFINAVHAMGRDGKLTVRTYTKKLKRSDPYVGKKASDVFRAGEKVAVAEVDDTGPGIPEHARSKIFEPFYTTKASGKGTGLGLSVTQKIIGLHRGTVTIGNRKEGGARVTIILKQA